ncbi:PO21 protein, partial [Glaucidium brasilianum]|nr:PO21 protein [Glaucidium brasilianum]
KAFDTVSHLHIIEALKQKGLDDHIIRTPTYMLMKNEHSDATRICIGVKQGNPMFLILFNLSVDPLLCKLEEEEISYQHYSTHIATKAFADDLVLLSSSWEGVQKNIGIVEVFYDLTGLKIDKEH